MSEKRFDFAVVVLGMHRSGTSALTGVLRSCGLTVPATLIPSSEANERGFWESEVVNSLNDSILEQTGQTWRSLEPISAAPLDRKGKARVTRQVTQALSREFANGVVPLIKDPRICRLLPLWEPALDKLSARTVYPFIVRHPVEIARSLGQRNDIDLDHALLLWVRYYLDAEVATRGKARGFVAYPALLDDWRQAIGSLHSTLSLPFDLGAVDENAIDQYLSRDLRHQSIPDETLFAEGDRIPLLADAFEVFSRWARGSNESAADYHRLDEARGHLDRIGPLLSGVVERVRAERKRRSVALSRADEAVANLARANQTIDNLGGLSAQLTEMANDTRLSDAVGTLAASQEARFGDLGRRVKKLVNEASEHAQAANEAQKTALLAAVAAIKTLASDTRQEALRSAASIEQILTSVNDRSVIEEILTSVNDRSVIEEILMSVNDRSAIDEILTSVNDRSAIESLAERQEAGFAAIEQRVGGLLSGLDERARFDAALADALEQSTALRQRVAMIEQQEQDARAVVRLHLGTIRVRDDEAVALKQRLDWVTEEWKIVKRKYRSTQEILARDSERLKEVRATLADAEATVARYRRSYPWRIYIRLTASLSRLRRVIEHVTGNPAAKRQERGIALLEQSSLFDRDWYLEAYPDVAASGIDPVRHYLDNGWREGRDPGPGFSTTAYLKAHADVAAHGTNPLLHYIEYGHSEGRGAPEHSTPATKALPPRQVFGPAAPCASFTLDPKSVVRWQRAGRFDPASANLYSLPSGLAVGNMAGETQAAFREAIEQLACLSGASGGAVGPLSEGDQGGRGRLIDAWYVGRNRLRSRWRTPDNRSMVVRILQQVDGPLELIGEALVGDDLDVVDAKLTNQFFPLLFVFTDLDGVILDCRLLAFPSLCRGGLHHAELAALVPDEATGAVDPCAAGARIANRLLAIRAGTDEALVAEIAVDLAGADGTHPLFQPNFQQWLAKVVQVSVRPLDGGGGSGPKAYLASSVLMTDTHTQPRAGSTLILGSDMVPSLAALSARGGGGEGDARDVTVSMIVSGEELSQPSLLAHQPAGSPARERSTFAPNFPTLSLREGSRPLDDVSAYAVRVASIRPLADAELLVPISPPALGATKSSTPITWLLWPEAWREPELLQSLEALAAQSDAGPQSIVFVGLAADAASDLAGRLFEGRVQNAAALDQIPALIQTPLVGFVGPSVILHARRTAGVMTQMLDDPGNISASVVLVSIERRGKGFLVTPTDEGLMTMPGTPPLAPQQTAASMRMVWGSSWPLSAPPRDLWLTRTEQLARWMGLESVEAGEGVHACSSVVTASYCGPRGAGLAAIAPTPVSAEDALRIELVV